MRIGMAAGGRGASAPYANGVTLLLASACCCCALGQVRVKLKVRPAAGADEPGPEALTCGLLAAHECMERASTLIRDVFEREYGDYVQQRIGRCFETDRAKVPTGDRCYYNATDRITGPATSAQCTYCGIMADYMLSNYLRGEGMDWPCHGPLQFGTLFNESAGCFGAKLSAEQLRVVGAADRTELADKELRSRTGVPFMRASARIDFCGKRSPRRAEATRRCFVAQAGGRRAMRNYCANVDRCTAMATRSTKGKCDSKSAVKRLCACMEGSRLARIRSFAGKFDAVVAATSGGALSQLDCVRALGTALAFNGADYMASTRRITSECETEPPPLAFDEMLHTACDTLATGDTFATERNLRLMFNVIDYMNERYSRYCSCLT